MKELKLEVGKTYRSRKGEEIKIVKNDGGVELPYQGSNGEWYTESGRWRDFGPEDPEDLIEEVPIKRCHAFITPEEAKKVTATRYTFAIPDGATKLTVEQVSNRIIVEMVPEAKEPKPGDIMMNENGSVYIFKEVINPNSHSQYAWLGKTGNLFIDYGRCAPGRPATPEEAKPLWDALKKAGKRWNPETMQVEDVEEIDRIREWAEKHYSNHQGIAEAIEAYLKYREESKKA